MAKLADKYAIGTEHVIDGKTVIVELSDPKEPCKGCAFLLRRYECILPLYLQDGSSPLHLPVCDSGERTDETDVIFKLKGGQ